MSGAEPPQPEDAGAPGAREPLGEAGGGWGPGAGTAPGAPAGGWSSAPSGPWGASTPPAGPVGGFAPPDPAAVKGPPWPELIAVGPYTPRPMIRWPIIGGLVLVVVYVVIVLIATNSTSLSQAAWLHAHQGTIDAFTRDQQNLATDNPTNGGNVSLYLNDWRKLHQDAAAAASLPNPGGAATAPWREMINDYFNGSAEIIEAIVNHNQSLLDQALRNLNAGDAAATQFNKAMGISPP